ncbi:hypothetical protein M595_1214 [Lyngbya aestuarii BL J]|uniref:Uncharacterized protein n=1 Tax=Lyngbya aestuarii BL J TaxID=1348334 RepID=U7QQR7_9CYAN|nr:hypothetical protein [Lyngbya aestuarii]ERT08771.1 hypothetical protein M595_1214 [Lyngbya aestuarii BL J]
MENTLLSTTIHLYSEDMIDYWNMELTADLDDIDWNGIELIGFRYLMIGNNRPEKVKEYNFFKWNKSAQELRQLIWEGVKLRPWDWYNSISPKLPAHKRLALELYNFALQDNQLDVPTVIVYEEGYQQHAEVILRATSFVKKLLTELKPYEFDMIGRNQVLRKYKMPIDK